MLAGTLQPPFILSPRRFPLLASAKLDGIRATIQNGKVMSRSLKPIANDYVQEMLGGRPELEGLDGELIVGDPADPKCFLNSGPVCTKGGKPNFVFYVFDAFHPTLCFEERLTVATAMVLTFNQPYVQMVPTSVVEDGALLHKMEALAVRLGYEGLMIRDPKGPYKQGRSTLNEGFLLKMKRFVDGEGVVLALIEGATNLNPAFISETGHTKRSTSKENKVPNGTLGAFLVRNLETGVEHKVSPSGTMVEVQKIWDDREAYVGKVLKFKYFATGSKEKPRFSQMIGFRDATDMDMKAGA
jgi:DNA ligase-1